MTAAALDSPTSAGEDPGHLIAAQVCPRRSSVAETMPYEGEAVRVDIENLEASGQHCAQLRRGRKQLRRGLSLRTGQDEQQRGHGGVLHHDSLPPASFRFR